MPVCLESSSTNIASDHGVGNTRRSIASTSGRSGYCSVRTSICAAGPCASAPELVGAHEDLAATRVDHRERARRLVLHAQRPGGERIKAADAGELHRERLGEAARGGDAYAQARESPGTPADRYPVECA